MIGSYNLSRNLALEAVSHLLDEHIPELHALGDLDGPRPISIDLGTSMFLDVEIDFHGDLDGPRPWSPKA